MSRSERCVTCGAAVGEPCLNAEACPFTNNELRKAVDRLWSMTPEELGKAAVDAVAKNEAPAAVGEPIDWDSPEARLFQYAMKPAAVAYAQRLIALQGVEIVVGDLWCPNSGGPYEILGLVEIAVDGPNTDLPTTQGVRVRDTARPEDSETVYPLDVFLGSFARVAR